MSDASRASAQLVALSLTGFGVSYATSLWLARELGPKGFDDYAVAVAALTVMATAVEGGIGKYGLEAYPRLVRDAAWAAAAGFHRFALRTVGLAALALGLIAAMVEGAEDHVFADYALGPAALFLPAVALSGTLAELNTALGAAVRAAWVLRVVIPGVGLAGILLWTQTLGGLDASRAVELYGVGWLVGAVLLFGVFRRRRPVELRGAGVETRARAWARGAAGYMAIALVASLLSKVVLLAFEWTEVAEGEVAVMAVVLETGGFVLMLSKSTDKLFVPEISAHLAAGDGEAVRALVRRRDRAMLLVTGLFMAGIWLGGRRLLGLFGPYFEHGYDALVVVSGATCMWTFASLSSWVLAITRGPRFPLVAQVVAVLAMAAGTLASARTEGLTGAEWAYAAPLALVSLWLWWFARRDLGAAAPAT